MDSASHDVGRRAGFTLIETVISVFILGLISTVFCASLTMVETSSVNQRAQRPWPMPRCGASRTGPSRPTTPTCTTPSNTNGATTVAVYGGNPFPASSGFTDTFDMSGTHSEGILFSQQYVASDSYLDPTLTVTTWAGSISFASRASTGCHSDNSGTDPGAQELFLTVQYTEGTQTVTRLATVVKRLEN